MTDYLTTFIFFAVMDLFLMILANKLYRFIGDSGTSIISRVMGLVLASVAIDNVLMGIKGYF